MKKSKQNLKVLKELFWDYTWESVLQNMDSPFVIARVLEIGNKEQVKALVDSIGTAKIKEFLEKYDRLLSRQSLNFWRQCYGIKEKKPPKRA